jgi:1-deoxyxylulose-5-phosphate synthase
MEYTRLGTAGVKVSRICLGMMSFGERSHRAWAVDEESAEPIVHKAVEQGVTFFDTADIYNAGNSELITGRLLGRLFAKRDDYVLATKVCLEVGPGPNDRGLSRKHILSSIDGSLRRLGTDYVDLYQIHRWDPDTPIEETMEALHDVVRAGKARYIGASSMYAWQFAKAQHTARLHGWTRFVSMQNHYNLAYREEEREMVPLCLDLGVGLIPWSPLARGLLTRRDQAATLRGRTDQLIGGFYEGLDRAVIDDLHELAQARELPPAQVALAWLLRKPGVVAPIIGATRTGHIEDAIAALDVSLSDEDIRRLEERYRPQRIRGHS